MTTQQHPTTEAATQPQTLPQPVHPTAAPEKCTQLGGWAQTGTAVFQWARRHPFLVLTVACVACLGPFANKAYHIDDPLFLKAAQHIREEPANFYNFPVIWY